MSDPRDPLHPLLDPLERAAADFDQDQAAADLHRRTAGIRPGSATRRRRALTGGGVLACAAAAVVTVAVTTGAADSPSPVAADPAVVSPTGKPSTSPSAQFRPAAWYAEQAIDAINSSDAILETHTATTDQVADETWHDESRTYSASDGRAERFINLVDSTGTFAPGEEDNKYIDEGGLSGTYRNILPSRGVYAEFHPTWEPGFLDDVGTVDQQIADHVSTIAAWSEQIEEWNADPHVTAGPAESVTIGGRSAVCFTYSQDDPSQDPDVGSGPLTWSDRTCLDAESMLPVLNEYTGTTQFGDDLSVTEFSTTSEYTWHPNTPENQVLLEPDLTGLTQISYDDFVALGR